MSPAGREPGRKRQAAERRVRARARGCAPVRVSKASVTLCCPSPRRRPAKAERSLSDSAVARAPGGVRDRRSGPRRGRRAPR